MVNLYLLSYCTFQKNPLAMSWFKKLYFYTDILLGCLLQKRTFCISSWWLESIWFPQTIFIIPSKELFGQQINWTECSASWVSSFPNSLSPQIILLSHKIEKHLQASQCWYKGSHQFVVYGGFSSWGCHSKMSCMETQISLTALSLWKHR